MHRHNAICNYFPHVSLTRLRVLPGRYPTPQLAFTLPKANITWASMFKLMQRIQHDQEFRVQDYSLAQTSLEKIFTAFAEKQWVWVIVLFRSRRWVTVYIVSCGWHDIHNRLAAIDFDEEILFMNLENYYLIKQVILFNLYDYYLIYILIYINLFGMNAIQIMHIILYIIYT